MKKYKFIHIALILLFVSWSCNQEVIKLQPPPPPPPPQIPSHGSADFTKFVAIGSSYVAGMQGGALFNDGQANSLPAILNKQFTLAGGTATFNQPNINATLGYNIFVSPNPVTTTNGPVVLGRMLLQGVSPAPTPQPYAPYDFSAVPNPSINPGFMFSGNKPSLNNFGVEAITLGQFLIPNTGNWADPNPAHGFSPFYARFATNPGTSTIVGDAAAAGGSFFLFWGGMDDYLLYAAYGGDATQAPLTSGAAFSGQYAAAIGTLLGSNANLKGVVANFPDIFAMPHFTSVPYNPIPLDAATATAVSSGFAGYNAALDGLIANKVAFGISDTLAAEIGTRKVTFAAGKGNKILISDETLTDLGPYFDGLLAANAITAGQRTALAPYQQVRQTTPTDIIPLSAGSVIGQPADPNNALLVYGVSVPLADRYVLIPSEILEINTARTSFNTTIASIAASNLTRVAFADVSSAFAQLVSNTAGVYNNVTITPGIAPPTGIYSEDGIHPNSRGYAFIANVFIDAIKTKHTAVIPSVDLSLYQATGLPIP